MPASSDRDRAARLTRVRPRVRGLAASAALGAACVVFLPACSSDGATTDTSVSSTPVPVTDGTGPTSTTRPGAVAVTFDTPGATPRPLRETVRPITGSAGVLRMDVGSITYSGIVCGFTFTGSRPASPVSIRVTGTAKNGTFDSGPLSVEWTDGADGADPEVTAGNATDDTGGWSFSAEAHVNRNGSGWVVSVGGVPMHKEVVGIPTSARCALTATAASPFVPANGPVGYWAGFATA